MAVHARMAAIANAKVVEERVQINYVSAFTTSVGANDGSHKGSSLQNRCPGAEDASPSIVIGVLEYEKEEEAPQKRMLEMILELMFGTVQGLMLSMMLELPLKRIGRRLLVVLILV